MIVLTEKDVISVSGGYPCTCFETSGLEYVVQMPGDGLMNSEKIELCRSICCHNFSTSGFRFSWERFYCLNNSYRYDISEIRAQWATKSVTQGVDSSYSHQST